MNHFSRFLVALCAALLMMSPAIAGPGHDHGDASPSASGPALPRFTIQSDLLDAVGVLGKDELVLFIDRAATNEPVLNATVELESGSVKAVGQFEAALGEYHFDGKPFQKTGVYPITLTIKAGKDTDLLSADLDVHGDEAKATSAAAAPSALREHAVWIGIAILTMVAALGALLVYLKKKPRNELRDRSVA